MIASLQGTLTEKNVSDAVVECHGVGYRVNLSLLTMASLPEAGAQVSLRIRTVVREDAFDLYGFLQRQEEELFLLLTTVSHVGPKLAMNVLSGLEVSQLIVAIAKGEVPRLTKIHGVGKKTAERLVLELKDKMKLLAAGPVPSGAKAAPAGSGARSDLISALVNLGYKEPQAQAATDTAFDRVGAEAAFELAFREALKVLRG